MELLTNGLAFLVGVAVGALPAYYFYHKVKDGFLKHQGSVLAGWKRERDYWRNACEAAEDRAAELKRIIGGTANTNKLQQEMMLEQEGSRGNG